MLIYSIHRVLNSNNARFIIGFMSFLKMHVTLQCHNSGTSKLEIN